MAKLSAKDVSALFSDPPDVKDQIKLDASLKGYTDFKNRLKKFDPALRKAMDREIRQALKPIADKAKSFVPDRPVSGWRLGSDRVGAARFPDWDPASVKKGIKVRQGGGRKRGNATQAAWKIQNSDAGGAALELAGRKTQGAGRSGQDLVSALTLYHGKPSRLIYRAWDEAGGEKKITNEVTAIVRGYEGLLERSLRSAKD